MSNERGVHVLQERRGRRAKSGSQNLLLAFILISSENTAPVGVRWGDLSNLLLCCFLICGFGSAKAKGGGEGPEALLGSSSLCGNSLWVAGSDGAVPSPSIRPQRIHTTMGGCFQRVEQARAGQFLLWILLA